MQSLSQSTAGLLLCALFLGQPSTSLPAESLFESVDVYRAGENGYAFYRIPAIATAADGSLLAFAEARKNGLNDPGHKGQEIDLVLKRSQDAGRTWSAMTIVEDAGTHGSSANPCVVVDLPKNRIWLFYLRGKPGRNTYTARPGTNDVETFVRTSDDHGASWSDPIDLTLATRDMTDPKWRTSVVGPGGGIATRDGFLAVPVWKFEPWGMFALVSHDHGKTWRRGDFVPGTSGDECQLLERADGSWLFDIRQSGNVPHRWRSLSRDHGQTWSAARAGEKVTRVACAIERLTLKAAGADRDRILWTGPKGPGRSNLVARVSYDEGQTFPQEREVFAGPAAYSDLTMLADQTVGLLGERGTNGPYERITFVRFNLPWLEE